MIGAGSFRDRCTFQKQTKVSDGGGGSTTVWVDQFTLWGRFDFPTFKAGMEAIAAGAVQATNSGKLTLRDTVNARRITKEWRVISTVDDSVSPTTFEVWNVRVVEPRRRDGYVRLVVEEGVPT